ncbi:MAG: Fic family protein [Candidatus Marinimicrobia bacterium]|nr:Fic family protein [Candidatus Neomarinimicrobiota bacterium]MBL7010790.1 Fic family protein [Candidatus Neomarinimicrobiota bacterium]MBL7030691.1 Fic family protein [Candidatus Neomarinimicrobiota bacterium]
MKKFKSGEYQQQDGYKSFNPAPINRQWAIENPEILELLGHADRELGRLDMFSEYVPDIDLFIYLHTVKEATQSSKIEGTQTNAEEIFIDNINLNPEQRLDKMEVQNYIRAIHEGVSQLSSLPISTRLIKKIHFILMQGVRGKNKTHGEYRISQNWIGGATLKDAVFIPPHHLGMNTLMGDFEKFLHNQDVYIPHLIKIAIAHYQFETIHPFLDGNGRIGRLIIPLYFMEKGLIKRPILYLSDYFEKHRQLYYDHLNNIRVKSDLTAWLKFFLVGIIETAKNGIGTFDAILKLQKSLDKKFAAFGKRSVHVKKLIDHLYENPVINSTKTISLLKVSKPTAIKLLTDLETAGILVETTGYSRNRFYLFQDYMRCFFND